jgi:hypothetical protein
MAISRITQGLSGSFSAGYAVNDLLVILAVNLSGSTVPTTPSGYTSLTSAQQSGSSALTVLYKVAASTSETYPTITNASDSVYAIYRGINTTTPFLATSVGGQSSSGSSTTISYSGIASFGNPGNDWVLTFGVSTVNGAAMPSFPATGQTLVQNSSNFLAIFDSNAAASSFSFSSKTLSASSITMTKTAELQLATAGGSIAHNLTLLGVGS